MDIMENTWNNTCFFKGSISSTWTCRWRVKLATTTNTNNKYLVLVSNEMLLVCGWYRAKVSGFILNPPSQKKHWECCMDDALVGSCSRLRGSEQSLSNPLLFQQWNASSYKVVPHSWLGWWTQLQKLWFMIDLSILTMFDDDIWIN